MIEKDNIMNWLLDGDVSIQYQVYRDLMEADSQVLERLKSRIASEGWGAEFLSRRNENGHWGRGFYQTKWVSTHYTLLDLKNLGIANDNDLIRQTIEMLLNEYKSLDGGINPHTQIKDSDVCVNGMFLNYASYFKADQDKLKSVIDCIVSQKMSDGGFNCNKNRPGAKHSSLHSTISILEGLLEYGLMGYTYRLDELKEIEQQSREFILEHKLFKSDKTGEIIDKRMLMLSYPSRWKYDILRALDYFRSAGVCYDPRMKDALDVIKNKRRKDGTWPLQAKHPGKVHFDMEQAGKSSRWNTLRALRVLKAFGDCA